MNQNEIIVVVVATL